MYGIALDEHPDENTQTQTNTWKEEKGQHCPHKSRTLQEESYSVSACLYEIRQERDKLQGLLVRSLAGSLGQHPPGQRSGTTRRRRRPAGCPAPWPRPPTLPRHPRRRKTRTRGWRCRCGCRPAPNCTSPRSGPAAHLLQRHRCDWTQQPSRQVVCASLHVFQGLSCQEDTASQWLH